MSAPSRSQQELISATYLRLRRMAFDGAAAANLTALKNGFAVCPGLWTVSELTHLLFLRESRTSCRRWSYPDDRAERAEPMPIPNLNQPQAAADGASSPPAGPADPGDPDPSDGRVTLLTLFRAGIGTTAVPDLLRPPARSRPGLDAAGGADREGG